MDKASITRFTLLTIPEDKVNDLIAIGSGYYFLYAGWKYNYLSKKGLSQKEVLKANKLK